MCICGNFGPEISCSNCRYYILIGVNSGLCEVDNYEDTMSSHSCDKFEKETGQFYVNKRKEKDK